MVIYHYVGRIWRVLVTPNFLYNIYDDEKYYPGEPVNIQIQSLINIIKENNREITAKKGKDELPLFCGNVERVIPIYGGHSLTIKAIPSNIYAYTVSFLFICIDFSHNPSISWFLCFGTQFLLRNKMVLLSV